MKEKTKQDRASGPQTRDLATNQPFLGNTTGELPEPYGNSWRPFSYHCPTTVSALVPTVNHQLPSITHQSSVHQLYWLASSLAACSTLTTHQFTIKEPWVVWGLAHQLAIIQHHQLTHPWPRLQDSASAQPLTASQKRGEERADGWRGWFGWIDGSIRWFNGG